MNPNAVKIVRDMAKQKAQVIGEEMAVMSKSRMKRMPFPSLPFNSPRIDTGRLYASIGTETRKISPDKIETRIGTDVFYGRYLETGTSRMKPRPWLRPALRYVANQYRFGVSR